jgi:hypothetical protein
MALEPVVSQLAVRLTRPANHGGVDFVQRFAGPHSLSSLSGHEMSYSHASGHRAVVPACPNRMSHSRVVSGPPQGQLRGVWVQPAAKLRAALCSLRLMRRGIGQRYPFVVVYNDEKWNLEKRFSEFADLDSALDEQYKSNEDIVVSPIEPGVPVDIIQHASRDHLKRAALLPPTPLLTAWDPALLSNAQPGECPARLSL